MENEKKQKPMEENIMDAIKSGRIAMRPRWHFILGAALFALGVFILLLVMIYLTSFIAFALKQTGAIFVPAFGPRGWRSLLINIPWLLIGLSLVFIVVLEVLVRRYSFAYRKPLLYSALGIIFIVIAGGIVLARTPLHQNLFQSAHENKLPVVGGFYRMFGEPSFRDIHRGKIEQLSPKGFIFEDSHGETSTVIVTPKTRIIKDNKSDKEFSKGKKVIIFGDRDDDEIEAIGVKEIGD